MSDRNQARQEPETVISVDPNAADASKAVTRRTTDIAAAARGEDEGDGAKPKSPAERDMMKRMRRLGKNLERQFDQRAASREAEWQRERSELMAKIDRITVDGGGGDDRADVAHDAAIKALQEKLEAAYEKGDSKASAQITREMSELDAKYWAAKAAKAGQTTRETATTDTGGTQQPTARAGKGPTAAGSRFITANEDWWDDPDFKVEQSAANTIFLHLTNVEGFDAKDSETFVEVAKQLREKFPKLAVKAGRKGGDPDDDDDPGEDDDVANQDRDADRGADEGHRSTRRAAAGGFQDRGQAKGRNRGGLQTLSKEDIETMKSCRMDPDNDKDVLTFMRERTAMENT